jgi:hypothetical protein
MGMLEQHMKKLPDGKQMHEYLKEMHSRLREYTEDGCEGYEIYVVDENNFEEYWEQQENLKKTDEVRQKYLDLAKQGKVIFVEIDW